MTSDLSAVFQLLASGFSFPDGERFSPAFFHAVKELAGACGFETGHIAYGLQELQEAYTRLFINAPGGIIAPPYASVYIAGQGLLMQEGHDQAREFYQKAGLEPLANGEPADFLPLEFSFAAILLERGDLELLSQFLEKHLWRWFQVFEKRVEASRPHPFYSLMVRLGRFYLKKLKEEVFDEAT